MKTSWKTWGAALASAFVASTAQAALVSNAGALGASFVIGFDTNPGSGYTAPVEVGGGSGYSVSFSTSGGTGSLGVAPFGVWVLEPEPGAGNGVWGPNDKTFAAVDGGVDPVIASMTFTLNGFTAFGIGGFLNFDPSFTFGGGSPLPLYIEARDASGAVLDSAELPIFTPEGVNAGDFYGFLFNSPDIASFYIEGPYAVIDDLTIAPIPEPSTYAMLLAGLGLLGLWARRAQRS
jgi:hypothetical protein